MDIKKARVNKDAAKNGVWVHLKTADWSTCVKVSSSSDPDFQRAANAKGLTLTDIRRMRHGGAIPQQDPEELNRLIGKHLVHDWGKGRALDHPDHNYRCPGGDECEGVHSGGEELPCTEAAAIELCEGVPSFADEVSFAAQREALFTEDAIAAMAKNSGRPSGGGSSTAASSSPSKSTLREAKKSGS